MQYSAGFLYYFYREGELPTTSHSDSRSVAGKLSVHFFEFPSIPIARTIQPAGRHNNNQQYACESRSAAEARGCLPITVSLGSLSSPVNPWVSICSEQMPSDSWKVDCFPFFCTESASQFCNVFSMELGGRHPAEVELAGQGSSDV